MFEFIIAPLIVIAIAAAATAIYKHRRFVRCALGRHKPTREGSWAGNEYVVRSCSCGKNEYHLPDEDHENPEYKEYRV